MPTFCRKNETQHFSASHEVSVFSSCGSIQVQHSFWRLYEGNDLSIRPLVALLFDTQLLRRRQETTRQNKMKYIDKSRFEGTDQEELVVRRFIKRTTE